MKSFAVVPGSEGPRREFKITWGLRAGYGSSGRIYDLGEAIRAAHRWMGERDARAEPFLSGMFTRGEVVYAGSQGEPVHDREPVAIFAGEVLPFYAADCTTTRFGACSTSSHPKSGESWSRRRSTSLTRIGHGP
jgi:hypothetical protein